jgi:hypothetical protein
LYKKLKYKKIEKINEWIILINNHIFCYQLIMSKTKANKTTVKQVPMYGYVFNGGLLKQGYCTVGVSESHPETGIFVEMQKYYGSDLKGAYYKCTKSLEDVENSINFKFKEHLVNNQLYQLGFTDAKKLMQEVTGLERCTGTINVYNKEGKTKSDSTENSTEVDNDSEEKATKTKGKSKKNDKNDKDNKDDKIVNVEKTTKTKTKTNKNTKVDVVSESEDEEDNIIESESEPESEPETKKKTKSKETNVKESKVKESKETKTKESKTKDSKSSKTKDKDKSGGETRNNNTTIELSDESEDEEDD